MIDIDALPTEKEDVVKIQLEFPRLDRDSPSGCPRSVGEVKRYVEAETGRKPETLYFGRTALVGDVRFWLWGFIDDGETCYVDVSMRGHKTLLGVGSGNGLTPEQYIALRYARRWRGRK